jgi:hypothetical protein
MEILATSRQPIRRRSECVWSGRDSGVIGGVKQQYRLHQRREYHAKPIPTSAVIAP